MQSSACRGPLWRERALPRRLQEFCSCPDWRSYVLCEARLGDPVPAEPFALSLTVAGALAINLSCAFLLTRLHGVGGSLMRAAFLSAGNDAVAKVAIVGAGPVTAYLWRSARPDVIVALPWRL